MPGLYPEEQYLGQSIQERKRRPHKKIAEAVVAGATAKEVNVDAPPNEP